VVNLSIDRRRKNHSRLTVASETLEHLQAHEAPELVDRRAVAPDDTYGRREFERFVQRCINQLSEKFSAILVLRYIEDLSYKEIGEILGCSIGTVKSRLSRAHKAMEAVMGPNLERYRV
jgi:RNA polymerase sigma-70 factor (ECF subfamily)